MSWFHFTKQERLKRNREVRAEAAESARKEARENPWMIQRSVKDNLRLAIDEELTFPDYFGEPMPQHLAMAIHFEILLWRRIEAALERVDTKGMTDEAYTNFRDGICALLLQLMNLLHAESEMVTSCLVRHYLELVRAIQAETARVSL